MQTSIIYPEKKLEHVVQYFWHLQINELPVTEIKTFADDSSGIIFYDTNNSLKRQDGIPLPSDFIYGQSTIPSVTTLSSPFQAFGVLFWPQAIKSLYGVDAHYLTDRVFSMNEFEKGVSLKERISNEPLVKNKISAISEYLNNKIENQGPQDKLVSYAVSLMKSNVSVRVNDVLSHLKISERQLERRFLTSIGVSPRHYIQTCRFKYIVNLMRTDQSPRFSEIAYDLCFSDQAHFNRLIRKFAGLSPGVLKSKIKVDLINLVLEK